MTQKFIHQKDLNGCGIATLANLLGESYDEVKIDFEKKFYDIKNGIKIFDMVKYLETRNLFYKSKFFNQNKNHEYNIREGEKFSQIENSITLIYKNEMYPIGHYLLRKKDFWIDPWIGYPSIDNVSAGKRTELPSNAWYVLYPKEG